MKVITGLNIYGALSYESSKVNVTVEEIKDFELDLFALSYNPK